MATYATLGHVGGKVDSGYNSSAGEGKNGGDGSLHGENRYRRIVLRMPKVQELSGGENE